MRSLFGKIEEGGVSMPFTIVRQDITKMNVDAIVNAANTALQMGGGVCGAIFHGAGKRELQAACDLLAPIEVGKAAIMPGFKLPAKYVIHAAGPVYDRHDPAKSEAKLRSAYLESLKLAEKHGCESIAFPLISSGIYGYPKEGALRVATEAIRDFLSDHDMEVYLTVFDKDSFVVSEKLMGQVASYIDEHYVDIHLPKRRSLLNVERELLGADYAAAPMTPISTAMPSMSAPMAMPVQNLDDLMDELDEPFSTTLLKLIDAKGMTDVEVYKRANMDRKLFSKIRIGKGYTPKKPTILALAIALKLTLAETDDLLERAGYALSHASKFDVIVEFFIVSGNYNIFELNEVLFKYDQPLLGA